MDIVDTETRSRMMSRIRGTDTKPEMAVRRLAHRMGYRFRLHRRDLVGNPDLVFPGRRKVIFVHGCFWHRHSGCRRAYSPKSNVGFWNEKFASNVARDAAALAQLQAEGWQPLVIWECETIDTINLEIQLLAHLGNPQ